MKRIHLLYLYMAGCLLALSMWDIRLLVQRNNELNKEINALRESNTSAYSKLSKCGEELIGCQDKIQWCKLK